MIDAALTGGTVDRARFRTVDDPLPGQWKQEASETGKEPSPFPDAPAAADRRDLRTVGMIRERRARPRVP
jgi:hypothetical protein